MRSGLIWQMLLHQKPDRVFRELVETANEHARLVRADAASGWVDFDHPGSDVAGARPLRATTRALGSGTLVLIGDAHGATSDQTPEVMAAEAASIGSLAASSASDSIAAASRSSADPVTTGI